MFSPDLLALTSGRRSRELKPLVSVFSDVLARHKAATEEDRVPEGVQSGELYAAECGVWQGQSLILCLLIAKRLGVSVKFLGLDTFSGLPDLTEEDLKAAPAHARYREKRWFTDTSLEGVQATIREAGFSNQVSLYPGLFSQSLRLLPNVEYSFVNIDCDLYGGHIECLEYFYPRMKKGGVIYFDDYHSEDFPMARRAIDDFLKSYPAIELMHLRFGDHAANAMKAFFVV